MVVALAAAGAGVGRAHQARGELVREIALEDAVLDEDVLLGGVALVVHIDGSAAVGHEAVVDDRYLFTGDLLANEAGEGGGLLAVEVRFQAMANGFVQQDAGPSGAEDDGHLAGWSRDCAELEDGGAGGLTGVMLRRVRAFEEVEGDATAAARGSACGGAGAFVAAGVLGDDKDVEAGERLGVGREGSVRRSDEDAAKLVVESGADLRDAWVEGAGGLVGALDEFELGSDLGVGGSSGDRIERGRFGGVAEAGHLLLGRTARDKGRRPRCTKEALGGKVVRVGVAGALAGEDADAAADADALRGGFYEGLVDAERCRGNGLKIKVRVVAASGECLAETAFHQALG